MRLHSLKVKIAITLALLLLVAIGLTNFLVFRVIEKNIIENHIKSARAWLAAMHETKPSLEVMLSELDGDEKHLFNGIAYAYFSGDSDGMPFSDTDSRGINRRTKKLVEKIEMTGQSEHLFSGREWGIFWQRSKYLVIGIPLPEGSGAGAAAIELGPDYQMLRKAQQIAMGYLFFNFLILFAAGLYRFSVLVTRPIHRFIRLTDNYRYSGPFDLFPEKHHDEFSRLSSSLNRIVRRIEDDKKELEVSVEKIDTANRSLKKAQQEIIRAEKLASIGRLSAGIAHEIGNPIGVVLGYLGLLKNASISPEDSNGMDYIERAEAEINRINEIIRQLLDFSRSNPGNFADFSVHDLLRDTGRMLSQQPLMENIRLVYDFSAAADTVYADYNQLHQVVVNLLINAADSIAAGENIENGEIRLATAVSEDGQHLCFEIVDNGGGVSGEHMDKIFDPFFTTKETGKGTGLGLYVSYMIIEWFGGSISVQNNDASGARMVILLPLSNEIRSNAQIDT